MAANLRICFDLSCIITIITTKPQKKQLTEVKIAAHSGLKASTRVAGRLNTTDKKACKNTSPLSVKINLVFA
jgi:hypothetical protein